MFQSKTDAIFWSTIFSRERLISHTTPNQRNSRSYCDCWMRSFLWLGARSMVVTTLIESQVSWIPLVIFLSCCGSLVDGPMGLVPRNLTKKLATSLGIFPIVSGLFLPSFLLSSVHRSFRPVFMPSRHVKRSQSSILFLFGHLKNLSLVNDVSAYFPVHYNVVFA